MVRFAFRKITVNRKIDGDGPDQETMEVIQGRHSESLNQGIETGNSKESDTGVRNSPT